jgi:crotonobetainyl-CoA:carnitine CoA-transferase CaiB-like acyl-CoA transferase
MPDQTTQTILEEIASALSISGSAVNKIRFLEAGRLASCFPVTPLAAASIAAAGLAISDLVGEVGSAPLVCVDPRLASLWFGFSIHPQGWQIAASWDDLAGDYRTSDGWIKLHTNAPHHKAAALNVLGCAANKAAVTDAVQYRNGTELEEAIAAAGGCAASLRSESAWLSHPQGRAVATEPLVIWNGGCVSPTPVWRPSLARPLSGLRVLDMTRVLAGPVATRFLAAFGAQVLRIDPPEWDEPGVIPEVTLGKSCARLDLKQLEGRRSFEYLLSQTDIFVHGLRGDALEKLGLDADVRQAIRPGLIDISLNAYGHDGPWASRRGFDSLVQFSSGIAHDGMLWGNASKPLSLPVQALDQATGYLMAAAAIRAVHARLRGEPLAQARLSLARTARLLQHHKDSFSGLDLRAVDEGDLSQAMEQTHWGPVRRFKAPISIDGCEMFWDRPASPLGSAPAEWR